MTGVLSNSRMPPTPFISAVNFDPTPSDSHPHPAPRYLIKGKKVIKEGHVTFPVTLNLIMALGPSPF